MKKTVKIMLSNRHAHVSPEIEKKLFGENGLTMQRFLLGDSGPFACNETITVQGPKGSISKVRVLGPVRNYNQVELLTADCYTLGVQAPVRMSSDLEGAAVLKLIGPAGEVELPCGIIAHRHIHMDPDLAAKYGISNRQKVSVKTGGIRGVTFDNVNVQVAPGPGTIMHVDIEEGNAAGIKNFDEGEIIP